MSQTKSNIEMLRAIINEATFKTDDAKDEAIEFLDAIGIEIKSLEEDIENLKDDVDSNEEKISKLEDDLDNQEFGETIHAGIGNINYEQPDNLQLQDIMESLNEQIKNKGPKKVMEILAVI